MTITVYLYRTALHGNYQHKRKGIFMKKTISFLLAFALFFSICTGCSPTATDAPPTNTPLPTAETKNELELRSGNSKITFGTENSEPYIFSLSNGETGNLIEKTPVRLPESALFFWPVGYSWGAEQNGFTVDENTATVTMEMKLEWRYDSTRKADDTETSAYEMIFINDKCNFEYRISIAADNTKIAEGPFLISGEFINRSIMNVACYLGDFVSVSPKRTDKDPVVWSFGKQGHFAEGGFERVNSATDPNAEKLTAEGDGTYKELLTKNKTVTASSGQNSAWSARVPFMYLDYNGEYGLYTALEWTEGTVKAQSKDGNITLSVNMDKENSRFCAKTAPQQTLTVPTVYLGCYTGDVDTGSNIYKKWFFNRKAPDCVRENSKEPYIQVDQLGVTYEKWAEIGFESIKWDYGWFSDYIFDGAFPGTAEGSWLMRNAGYQWLLDISGATFENYGDLLEERGLTWAVYLLLHDCIDENNKVTEKYGEFNSITHPEWFVDDATEYKDYNFGCAADLGNEECVEYIKKTLLEFFGSHNITTWRSDFGPIASASAYENRHMAGNIDVGYWCTVGFFDIVDYLYENLENFRYESCCEGGGMKDLMTATRAAVINCDDSANYLSLRTTFYDASYTFCPAQLLLPCGTGTFVEENPWYWPKIESDQENLREAVIYMGMRSCMLGGVMFAGLDEGMDVIYKECLALYKEKIRPLVREGDLYHVLDRPDGTNWDGVMYADADSSNDVKGALFVFKPSCDVETTKNVKLRGLYKDTMYKVVFEDGTSDEYTATGEQLMTDGVNVTINGVGSEIVWIYEA